MCKQLSRNSIFQSNRERVSISETPDPKNSRMTRNSDGATELSANAKGWPDFVHIIFENTHKQLGERDMNNFKASIPRSLSFITNDTDTKS